PDECLVPLLGRHAHERFGRVRCEHTAGDALASGHCPQALDVDADMGRAGKGEEGEVTGVCDTEVQPLLRPQVRFPHVAIVEIDVTGGASEVVGQAFTQCGTRSHEARAGRFSKRACTRQLVARERRRPSGRECGHSRRPARNWQFTLTGRRHTHEPDMHVVLSEGRRLVHLPPCVRTAAAVLLAHHFHVLPLLHPGTTRPPEWRGRNFVVAYQREAKHFCAHQRDDRHSSHSPNQEMYMATRKAAKKAAKKSARRPAKKAAKKTAKRGAAKKTAKRGAAKKTAKRGAAKKTTRRSAAKKSTARRG